jgi:alanine racemase
LKLDLTIQQFSDAIGSTKLLGQNGGIIHQIAYDTRKISSVNNTVFFALSGKFRDGQRFVGEAYEKGIRYFVVSSFEGIDAYSDACFFLVHSPLEALQKLATFHRNHYSIPVVIITGSVGKTMIKEWLYHLLSSTKKIVRSPKSFNSQLGVALSLLEINDTHELALIEAGISEPNEMQSLVDMIQPTYGIFTAFGRAHAHNFDTKVQHLSEKLKAFRGCKTTWISDDILLDESQLNAIHGIYSKADSTKYLVDLLPYQDGVSRRNLALALSVAMHFEKNTELLIEKIKSLPRLALRMETFEGINQTTIINDSYNLDVDALMQSLEYQLSISVNKKRIAIIATTGFSDIQIAEVKAVVSNFNLDAVYYLDEVTDVPISEISDATVLIKGTRSAQLQKLVRLFQLKKHKTTLEIDLSAVKHNVEVYRSLIPASCMVLAMVKASSYGSGAIKMAQYLQKIGVNYLGVAYADEGVELRKHGITLPILVMNAEEDGFDDIVQYHLEPAIYSFKMLDDFIKTLIREGIENYPVHLKFDTGMRRLGFEFSDLDEVLAILQTQPEIKLQSVYSHLADADNQSDATFTLHQIKKFNDIVSYLDNAISYTYIKHLANSEAIGNYPSAHFDMVRLGIGMYGYSTNPKVHNLLQEAVAWKSVVTQVKTIQAGESVGYGCNFVAQSAMKIAVIPIGYADGFRRSLSNGVGSVVIQGVHCPVVGNVCMDMTMVDVSAVAVYEGDAVEIIGEHQSLSSYAQKMNTIPYEVLTSVSSRVHRVYVES